MSFSIPSDGIYLINANIKFESLSEEQISFGISVNGISQGSVSAHGCNDVNISQIINVNKNDMVETFILGNSGSPSIEVSFIGNTKEEGIFDLDNYYELINKGNKFKGILYAW